MKPYRFPGYGWAGLAVIFLAEVVLFAGVKAAAVFFTPLVWSGYILFIDALVFKKRGASYLVTRRSEFLAMLPLSIIFWLVFEGYNLFLGNWRYVGLPENFWIRIFGYTWSCSSPFFFLPAGGAFWSGPVLSFFWTPSISAGAGLL